MQLVSVGQMTLKYCQDENGRPDPQYYVIEESDDLTRLLKLKARCEKHTGKDTLVRYIVG